VRAELAGLRQRCIQRAPSPETRLMIAAALASGIPVLPAGGSPSLWQFGWGVRSDLYWITSSNSDGLVGARLSDRKHHQKRLFEQLGLPTPRWRLLTANADLAAAIRHVGFRCVVKPTNRSSGLGVTANIGNMETLRAAIALARPLSPHLILEAHEAGHNHRLMIVNGRLEMALRLDPPRVRGDGRSTVAELVAMLNRQRAGDRSPGSPEQVPVDEGFTLALMSQQLTAESVPDSGREILLRTNANRATGGIAVNVLREVHPSIRRHAELLAEAAGFRTVGIDYVTPDIGKSREEAGGGFIEINATPGMMRAVLSGLVDSELAKLMIGPRPGRIPVSLLVAPATRLEEVARKLAAKPDESIGIAAGKWAQAGSVRLPEGDRAPIDWVTALLRYKSISALQILWTPEELVDSGLPVDSPDRVVLLETSLDGPWSEVVKARAGEILAVATNTEAVRLLKQRIEKGLAGARPAAAGFSRQTPAERRSPRRAGRPRRASRS
jgi:cyanophycin synthetase